MLANFSDCTNWSWVTCNSFNAPSRESRWDSNASVRSSTLDSKTWFWSLTIFSFNWLTLSCSSRANDDSFFNWLILSAKAMESKTTSTMLPTGMAYFVHWLWGRMPNSFRANTDTAIKNVVKATSKNVADFCPPRRTSRAAGTAKSAADATTLISKNPRFSRPVTVTATTTT